MAYYVDEYSRGFTTVPEQLGLLVDGIDYQQGIKKLLLPSVVNCACCIESYGNGNRLYT